MKSLFWLMLTMAILFGALALYLGFLWGEPYSYISIGSIIGGFAFLAGGITGYRSAINNIEEQLKEVSHG